MNRKFVTATVAGLFAVPAAALAQSNLTISGFLKGGFEALSGTRANMWEIGYSYDLSRRTSIAPTYATINNHANAGYNLYNSASEGLVASGMMAGEDPRMFGTTLRHAFWAGGSKPTP